MFGDLTGIKSYSGDRNNNLKKRRQNSSDNTTDAQMPFGKYKGQELSEVPDSYLLWLYENGKCFGELRRYIEDNLDAIKENAIRESKNFEQ